MVVNGVLQASGDQDTEDTELMAIYTKANQGAEKVEERSIMGASFHCSATFLFYSLLHIVKKLIHTLSFCYYEFNS